MHATPATAGGSPEHSVYIEAFHYVEATPKRVREDCCNLKHVDFVDMTSVHLSITVGPLMGRRTLKTLAARQMC